MDAIENIAKTNEIRKANIMAGFAPKRAGEPLEMDEATFNKAVVDNSLEVYEVPALNKYKENLQKAFDNKELDAEGLEKGRKDMAKLVRVVKVDKNGKKTTVWVKPHEVEAMKKKESGTATEKTLSTKLDSAKHALAAWKANPGAENQEKWVKHYTGEVEQAKSKLKEHLDKQKQPKSIEIADDVGLASYAGLKGKKLEVVDTKIVNFASGKQKYFVVKDDRGNKVEVAERHIKSGTETKKEERHWKKQEASTPKEAKKEPERGRLTRKVGRRSVLTEEGKRFAAEWRKKLKLKKAESTELEKAFETLGVTV